MKTNSQLASLLVLGIFLLASGCAEPDEPTVPVSPVSSQGDSKSEPATEQLLNEKYNKLELSCHLDISDKLKVSGNEASEVKSISARFNMLKNLGVSPAISLQLNMTDLQSTWELSIKSVTLQHVNYSSPTDSFEADRSPVIEAVLKGTLKKPTRPAASDQKTIQLDLTNSENQIFENTTVSFVDFSEGPVTGTNFNLKVSCRLDALPKPEFAGEFRRK